MEKKIEWMGKVLCNDCGRDFGLIFVNITENWGVNETSSNKIICTECLYLRENENKEDEGGV